MSFANYFADKPSKARYKHPNYFSHAQLRPDSLNMTTPTPLKGIARRNI